MRGMPRGKCTFSTVWRHCPDLNDWWELREKLAEQAGVRLLPKY